MNTFAVLAVALVLVVSAQAGPHRVVRQSGWGSGWAAPPPSTGVVIGEEGASEAVGTGGAIAEHDATVSVSGDHEVPALVSLSTGSGVGLYQSASNYQQSQINTDGSSNAYQANSASNSGYGSDFLYGDAQGLNVDVQSNGWSAVEGDGAVGQVDTLNHQGPVVAPHPTQSGWRRP